MRFRDTAFAALAALACASAPAHAVELVKNDQAQVNLNGMIQMFGFGQSVDDPYANHDRLYLFVKEARLNFNGKLGDYRFNVETAYAGENQVAAPNPGVALDLLDFSFDIPTSDFAYVRVGQFKVPYSRERLLYSGDLDFADRLIDNLMFQIGRDVGATFAGQWGEYALAAGVFTGGGRDIPVRYLPQHIGTPMLVLRTGWNGGYDSDAMTPGTTFDERKPGQALYLNALAMRDSRVGHSTALDVKLSDKSLLTNSNWNPYVGQAPLNQGDLWQLGTDYAIRAPMGDTILAASAELNHGTYFNSYGRVSSSGGTAQVAARREQIEVGLRYSAIVPDENFTNSGKQITGTRPIQEATPSLSYFMHGERTKLILDLPWLIGVPVVTEPGVGSYVATEQPDQVTVLKTGSVDRQNVIEARALLQLSF